MIAGCWQGCREDRRAGEPAGRNEVAEVGAVEVRLAVVADSAHADMATGLVPVLAGAMADKASWSGRPAADNQAEVRALEEDGYDGSHIGLPEALTGRIPRFPAFACNCLGRGHCRVADAHSAADDDRNLHAEDLDHTHTAAGHWDTDGIDRCARSVGTAHCSEERHTRHIGVLAWFDRMIEGEVRDRAVIDGRHRIDPSGRHPACMGLQGQVTSNVAHCSRQAHHQRQSQAAGNAAPGEARIVRIEDSNRAGE